MAAIDKLRCRYYSDFKDFVVWCMIYKPSLLMDFVREYLETQCGYKKANWFVKLFWKYLVKL